MDVRLIYNGTDITEYAEIVGAVCEDCAGSRADTIEITMLNAAQWLTWAPKRDDTIEITESSYSSGRMYIDTIAPTEERITLFATSMPSIARQKRWQTYENTTMQGILRAAGAELKMEHRIIGLDENTRYPFLMRKDETAPAFLRRILRLEGAVLKCVAGRLAAIGIDHCQNMTPSKELEITASTPGIEHKKIEGRAYASARVHSLYGNSHASDTATGDGLHMVLTNEPVYDTIQAYRWARGALLTENRRAEEITISMGFDPALTAMLPVSLIGEPSFAGKWLIDSVEHDLIELKSTCRLLRCVTTIR